MWKHKKPTQYWESRMFWFKMWIAQCNEITSIAAYATIFCLRMHFRVIRQFVFPFSCYVYYAIRDTYWTSLTHLRYVYIWCMLYIVCYVPNSIYWLYIWFVVISKCILSMPSEIISFVTILAVFYSNWLGIFLVITLTWSLSIKRDIRENLGFLTQKEKDELGKYINCKIKAKMKSLFMFKIHSYMFSAITISMFCFYLMVFFFVRLHVCNTYRMKSVAIAMAVVMFVVASTPCSKLLESFNTFASEQ